MHSFYDIQFVIKLPLKNVTRLILKALEKEKETAAWDLWSSMYPAMMIGYLNFISFDDFLDLQYSKQYKYTQKTNEEIVKEMEGIVAKYKGR